MREGTGLGGRGRGGREGPGEGWLVAGRGVMLVLSWGGTKGGQSGRRGAGNVAGRAAGTGVCSICYSSPRKGPPTSNPGLKVRKRRLERLIEKEEEQGKTRTLSLGAALVVTGRGLHQPRAPVPFLSSQLPAAKWCRAVGS